MTAQLTILLIHCGLTELDDITQTLVTAGMRVVLADAADDYLGLTIRTTPALVIVAEDVPGGGLAICRELRNDLRTTTIPRLLLAAAPPNASLNGLVDMWLAPPLSAPQLLALARLLMRVSAAERQPEQLPYEQIVQTALEGFWIIRVSDMHFLAVNDTYCAMSGYSRSELLKLHVGDIEAVESPQEVEERRDRIMTNGFDHFEARHRHKDGTIFDVEVSVRYINVAATEAIMVVFARDITDRKRAEDALRRSEARYRTLISALPDRVFRHSPEGIFVDYHNPRDADLIMPPEAFLGQHYRNVTPPEISEPFTAAIARARQSGQMERFEYELSSPDGLTHIFETRLVIGEDQDIVTIVRDITEHKRAEAARERLSEDLARKNRELEQIVYVASHDLRSPLVNVQGFSRELRASLDDLRQALAEADLPPAQRNAVDFLIDEDIPESLDFILTGVSKMDALLHGLLRLSRLGRAALSIEPLNVDQIVAETLAAFDFQIKQAGALVSASPLPRCCGDAIQVGQIFANLLSNALKYLAPGRPGEIKISGHSAEGMAIYCVADNGQGIAPDQQNKIFEMYYRVNPAQSEGDGLGLTIVRTIADRHGGWVKLTSEPEGGSRFFVALPEVL